MLKNLWRTEYDETKWPHNKAAYEWLKNQPLWHDHDMWIALCFGAFLGFLIGQLV
jgi:hypothetical protein